MVAKKRARSVMDELLEDLRIAPKPGEQSAAFLVRLMKKVNSAPDDVWEGLSEEAQSWYNDAATAREERQPIPLPEGFTTIFEEELASSEEEEDLQPKTLTPKKEAPRKAVPAKKAPRAPNPDQHRGAAGAGRKGKYAEGAVITVRAGQNPFRAGTKAYGWFSCIETGMTLSEAVAAGAPRSHIRWAHSLGHLDIG